MARILIAGCGWLGAALGTELAARGDNTVWGLRRRTALLPTGIEPIAADLDHRNVVAAAMPALLDAVVYAAAPDAGDEDSYERTYVRGLTNVIDAVRASASERARAPNAHRRGATAILLLSSTSVYGQTAGEWVDETSPTEPVDFRGQLVLRGEEIALASGLPTVSLRLGGLYGPGRTSLLAAVRDGRATVSSGASRFTNRIHRDDAVGAIVHLLDLLAPPATDAATIYIGVDEEPADRNAVVRWLAQRLGVGMKEGAGGRRDVGSGREAGDRRDTNKRCSSARLRASGFGFRYPTYRQGYEALLAAEGRERT